MKFPRQSVNKPGRRDVRGAVLPVVALIMVLGLAFVAFVADVMRTAYTSSSLRYGAEAAALGAFSSSLAKADQMFDRNQAEVNIRMALAQASGAGGIAWNVAPYGPDSSQTGEAAALSAVQFDDSDVTFVPNPNPADNGDYFLQVRARRDGNDSLKLFFLPLIYAFDNGIGAAATVPAGARMANPNRLIEVISQPASRIGAGVPRGGSTGARNQELSGFATFPLAISNKQFAAIANPAAPSLGAYTISLSPALPAGAGTIRGAFVNLTQGPSDITYYNDASSSANVNQLINNLAYFCPAPSNIELTSAIVERGSQLSAFNLSSNLFSSVAVQQQLQAQLKKLQVGRSYIFPVVSAVAGDAGMAPGRVGPVVGFARMNLVSAPAAFNAANYSFSVQLVPDSVALRNASFANGQAAVPPHSSASLPAPVSPFLARKFQGGALDARPRSLVMAPSLSPRIVQTQAVN